MFTSTDLAWMALAAIWFELTTPKEHTMPSFSPPAHKATDPDKLPGQIVNPIPLNTDMMDSMMEYAGPHRDPVRVQHRVCVTLEDYVKILENRDRVAFLHPDGNL